MDSVPEVTDKQGESQSGYERSTVDFSYTDQDSAVEVVKGVHSAGGTACDSDQLAAELNLEAKGGGFRMRINGAKTFSLITYERGGRITLTELGQQIIDPLQERQARVQSFLAVELYQKVFEQFKGGPLPPQAGLDRALVSLGVGARVKEKARQVLMRSAKQAGFLEYAPDRLVKPSVKTDAQQRPKDEMPAADQERKAVRSETGGSGGGGDGDHPLIRGLLQTLPKPGEAWAAADRLNWLKMADSIFKMIYKRDANEPEIQLTIQGGAARGREPQ